MVLICNPRENLVAGSTLATHTASVGGTFIVRRVIYASVVIPNFPDPSIPRSPAPQALDRPTAQTPQEQEPTSLCGGLPPKTVPRGLPPKTVPGPLSDCPHSYGHIHSHVDSCSHSRHIVTPVLMALIYTQTNAHSHICSRRYGMLASKGSVKSVLRNVNPTQHHRTPSDLEPKRPIAYRPVMGSKPNAPFRKVDIALTGKHATGTQSLQKGSKWQSKGFWFWFVIS